MGPGVDRSLADVGDRPVHVRRVVPDEEVGRRARAAGGADGVNVSILGGLLKSELSQGLVLAAVCAASISPHLATHLCRPSSFNAFTTPVCICVCQK